MAKYLHYYTDEQTFEMNYAVNGPVEITTAFTITGASVYSNGNYQDTDKFNGRYVKVKDLPDLMKNPAPGDSAGLFEKDGVILLFSEFRTQALAFKRAEYVPGITINDDYDTIEEKLSYETTPEGWASMNDFRESCETMSVDAGYMEPWVSYTNITGATDLLVTEHVNYNKFTPEQAFAAGNFVRVSYNFDSDEYLDGTKYERETLCSIDFGHNFDNSVNSVFVSSGELYTNFMQMYNFSGDGFDTGLEYSGFENGKNSFRGWVRYDESGGWTNFLHYYTPQFPVNMAYKCFYDNDGKRWYAVWTGPVY